MVQFLVFLFFLFKYILLIMLLQLFQFSPFAPSTWYPYKTTNAQNHQKIELYGSLTTKELKKPFRCVEGVKTRRLGDMEQAVPHPHVVDKN